MKPQQYRYRVVPVYGSDLWKYVLETKDSRGKWDVPIILANPAARGPFATPEEADAAAQEWIRQDTLYRDRWHRFDWVEVG